MLLLCGEPLGSPLFLCVEARGGPQLLFCHSSHHCRMSGPSQGNERTLCRRCVERPLRSPSQAEAVPGGCAPVLLRDDIRCKFGVPLHHCIGGVAEHLTERFHVASISKELACERAA